MKKLLLYILLTSFSNNLFAQSFTETSVTAGMTFSRDQLFIMGGGVSILDYDNDGWEDIFLPGGYGLCALYKNNGNGTFTDVLPTVLSSSDYQKIDSLFVISSIVGDIDNDGDKDIFLTTHGFKADNGALQQANVLLENMGNNSFQDISLSANIVSASFGMAATMGDYNLDGYLDIYVSSYVNSMSFTYDTLGNQTSYIPVCGENFLYINNGNKTFTEAGLTYGVNTLGCTLTSSFTDYDNDNDVDILVANDFGEWSGYPNILYRNDYPTNSFSNESDNAGFNRQMYGMGIASGDYDEDGFLDYYVTNIGANSLYKNNGNGTFTDVAVSLGLDNTWGITDSLRKTSWGCNFFDIDNDTYLDLYVSSGYVESSLPQTIIEDSSKLFYNNGNGTFSDISVAAGLSASMAHRGSAIFDYDNDGNMDLVVNHARLDIMDTLGIPQNLSLYHNDNSNGNNWLKIKLSGVINNKDGYGSKVKIFIGNRTLIREIDGGSSHTSINSSIAHFGLANHATVDSVKVYWLGGGVQTLYNIPSNQTLTVTETINSAVMQLSPSIADLNIYPTLTEDLSEVNITLFSKKNESLHLTLTNVLGSTILEKEMEVIEGQNIIYLKDWINPSNKFSNQVFFLNLRTSSNFNSITKISVVR